MEKETYIEKKENYCKILMNIFKKCSLCDKILLTLLKLINILIILIILLGFLAPRHLLLWHCTLCFITLYILISESHYNINNLTSSILKRNNNVSEKEIIFVSESKLLNINTYKLIIFICMGLSIFGYIYPEYSGNTLLQKFNNKLNLLDNEEETKFIIATEFETNKIPYKLTKDNLDSLDNNELNILKNEMEDIDINNVDMNLSVFNIIEPIKIDPKKLNNLDNVVKLENIVKRTYNMTNVLEEKAGFAPVNISNKEPIINKTKLLESLRQFNDILI